MGPGMQGPSRPSRGRKPPLKVDNMEIVDFPAGVPTWADTAQLLFMLPITVPAPAAQFEVVLVATDPRTPAQYDGLMAEAAKTSATSKGKTKAVPMEEDASDYGQSSKEDKEEEEGETPAQRIQQNKKLTKKKANRAEAAAALARRAQNDFSGRIPDGLGVKIWGPLNVEQLNSFFRRALGPSFYYSHQTNTVLVGADANRAAAYEFNSGNAADTPQTMHPDMVLQDRTMQILLEDLSYQDLPNPVQGPEDMAIIERQHIPARFLRTKDDGTSALRVMRAPDPKRPFDLEQIAQYALIYGRPGLENTWQGIASSLRKQRR
ncbi:hypothetical protein C0993_011077 [Termitomyces sp. T159_Od127]|nr:hypothetical protein C0993_011077 [Termitomyces sp. T159_Od127]